MPFLTVLLLIVVTVTGFGTIMFISYLIHAALGRNYITLSLPSFIPWGGYAKVRRARAEVELEKAKADLFNAKHQRLQQELVYQDLENTRYTQALEEKNPS